MKQFVHPFIVFVLLYIASNHISVCHAQPAEHSRRTPFHSRRDAILDPYILPTPTPVACNNALLFLEENVVSPGDQLDCYGCIPPLGEKRVDVYLSLISPSGESYSITPAGQMVGGFQPYYKGVVNPSACRCESQSSFTVNENMQLGTWTALIAVLPEGADPLRKNVLTYDADALTVVKPGRFPIKVLTIVVFEDGDVRGDFPGEAQLWVENEGMTRELQIPGAYSKLYCNDAGHCLTITGMGTANATASLMAVGLNPDLDLRNAYCMVAGLAGTVPRAGTLGAAAWAEWIVDSDLCHEIDVREMPLEWTYPRFRLGCTEPWCDGMFIGTEVFHLNPVLVEWAYRLSKDTPLLDSQQAQDYRNNYPADFPARQPPFVTKGDCIAGSTFKVGAIMSEWSEWWMTQWTGGAGSYAMTSMEDSGISTALMRLAQAGLVDPNRVMILRCAADFDQQYPGQSAIQSLGAALSSDNPGYPLAIENAYRVGSEVTRYIISHWGTWKGGVPPIK